MQNRRFIKRRDRNMNVICISVGDRRKRNDAGCCFYTLTRYLDSQFLSISSENLSPWKVPNQKSTHLIPWQLHPHKANRPGSSEKSIGPTLWRTVQNILKSFTNASTSKSNCLVEVMMPSMIWPLLSSTKNKSLTTKTSDCGAGDSVASQVLARKFNKVVVSESNKDFLLWAKDRLTPMFPARKFISFARSSLCCR